MWQAELPLASAGRLLPSAQLQMDVLLQAVEETPDTAQGFGAGKIPIHTLPLASSTLEGEEERIDTTLPRASSATAGGEEEVSTTLPLESDEVKGRKQGRAGPSHHRTGSTGITRLPGGTSSQLACRRWRKKEKRPCSKWRD